MNVGCDERVRLFRIAGGEESVKSSKALTAEDAENAEENKIKSGR
jgi:hypothetical protein